MGLLSRRDYKCFHGRCCIVYAFLLRKAKRKAYSNKGPWAVYLRQLGFSSSPREVDIQQISVRKEKINSHTLATSRATLATSRSNASRRCFPQVSDTIRFYVILLFERDCNKIAVLSIDASNNVYGEW